MFRRSFLIGAAALMVSRPKVPEPRDVDPFDYMADPIRINDEETIIFHDGDRIEFRSVFVGYGGASPTAIRR